MNLDDSLMPWTKVEPLASWNALLLGNGASIAISSAFHYDSLYAKAAKPAPVERVFDSLGTTNFELVLDALGVSSDVCDALGHDTATVHNLVDEVRELLFATVRDSHPSRSGVDDNQLSMLYRCLSRFAVTFTTNYDLLPYWAMMQEGSNQVKDLFWGADGTFDSSNCTTSQSTLLYLHGALHLYFDSQTGLSGKRTGQNLLENPRGESASRHTLLVSEASSLHKVRSIRRSNYLAYAHDALSGSSAPLVIFGHGLADNDQHIVDAVKRQSQSKLAVSVHRTSGLDVIGEKKRVLERLSRSPGSIYFFDSASFV